MILMSGYFYWFIFAANCFVSVLFPAVAFISLPLNSRKRSHHSHPFLFFFFFPCPNLAIQIQQIKTAAQHTLEQER